MAKEITINKLAAMVKGGFDEVHEKMDKRFDAVGASIEQLKTDVKHVKSSVRVLSGDMAEIKVRMEEQRHEERIRLLEGRVNRIERIVEQAQ